MHISFNAWEESKEKFNKIKGKNNKNKKNNNRFDIDEGYIDINNFGFNHDNTVLI